ncbi:MAG: prolyl-tRNA synthetase associated domain-containing protein [Micavibrio sp.]|nr:prolyl-tRNA synthetase associated domain-containing protein [Micavibrio sp.]
MAASTPVKIDTPAPVAGIFDKLGISVVTYAHAPVFTVEEGRDFKHLMPGGHTKNLFLKDHKGKLFLVTALWDTQIDLKKLPARLSAGRFSFGNAALLEQTLGVTPGSVTPLAVMNDSERQVTPVLDARMMDEQIVNCHPLINDKTTAMGPKDLLKFMESFGYTPIVVDFSRL